MKFAIQSNMDVQFTEVCRLKSKNGLLALQGDISAKRGMKVLSQVPEVTALRFLAELGKEFQKKYKGALKTWEKDILSKLNKTESSLKKVEEKFVKAAKKNVPTAKQIETFEKSQNAVKDAEIGIITDFAKNSYVTMVEKIFSEAVRATSKGMSDISKIIKKDTAGFIWTTVKFLIVAGLIVASAVAIAASGGTAAVLGVGIAAIVIKSLSASGNFIKECFTYHKKYDSALDKIDTQLDTATTSINKAIENMRIAQGARDVMMMRLVNASMKLEEAQKNLAKGGSDAEVKKAKALVTKKQQGVLALNKEFGGNPDMALSKLEAARKGLVDAKNAMPVKSKNASGMLGKAAKGLDEVANTVEGILGGI